MNCILQKGELRFINLILIKPLTEAHSRTQQKPRNPLHTRTHKVSACFLRALLSHEGRGQAGQPPPSEASSPTQEVTGSLG